MSTVRRAYDNRMAQRMQEEDRTAQVQKYVSEQRAMEAASGGQLRAEQIRRRREHAEIRMDIRMESELQQADRSRAEAARSSDKEQRLAHAMEQKKREDLRRAKDLQVLREGNDDLRTLQMKFKSAFMQKEREAQLAEKQALSAQLEAQQGQIERQMEADRVAAIRGMEAEHAERAIHLTAAKGILDAQMEEREAAKEHEKLLFAQEKDMVDAIVAKIEAQDEEEDLARQKKQMETQEYLKGFMKWHDEEKHRRVQADLDEEAKIQAYADFKLQQEIDTANAKVEKERERGDALEKVKGMQRAAQMEKEEMESLINEVYYAEQEEEQRQKERAKSERIVRERAEMMSANKDIMVAKKRRAAAEAIEEDGFIQIMMNKYAEEDRIEQMNAQKRRMKVAEHKRAVDGLLQARREAAAFALESEQASWAREAAIEEGRVAAIEDERLRMLREFASNFSTLDGFLPPGLLQKESDLDLFPANIRDEMLGRLAAQGTIPGPNGAVKSHGRTGLDPTIGYTLY